MIFGSSQWQSHADWIPAADIVKRVVQTEAIMSKPFTRWFLQLISWLMLFCCERKTLRLVLISQADKFK
jgi:hypothetical protein